MSVEASDIYSHIVRGRHVKRDYVGMIPMSLELLQLHKQDDFSTFESKKNPNKSLSNDVINIKFDRNVKSGEELIKIYTGDIESSEDEEYKSKLVEDIAQIKYELESDKNKWTGVSTSKLREKLYAEGFTITQVNEDGELLSKIEYVVYKRSSAKSREGNVLAIKKSLHEYMINWSRMNLPFVEVMEVDYPSLLAYESLVGSSIIDTKVIDVDNILIVEDVSSTFNEICNVVRTNSEDRLDSFSEDVVVSNSLFDGESLLDSGMFDVGTSMALLRNHMFKSAAFACNIQKFMVNNCPEGINFDEWEIKDMFGNGILAKNIKMITCPSSVKCLKFSHVLGSESVMWDHWKKTVSEEGNLFGICKFDKSNGRGFVNNKPLQRTSYQMLNSLPGDKEDMKKLSQFEQDYIMTLKNDDEAFITYLKNEVNEVNANNMFVDLYNINKDIVRTKVFRTFRSKTISAYVNHVKKGKIRLQGDYLTMLGNPSEFLYHAIGEDITEPRELHNNQVYTTMFEFGKELSAFRNPHTSQSNVLVMKNTDSEEIKEYFELTDNIVVVNAIGFNLQNFLSGCDYDSDTIVAFLNENMLELSKRCYGHYKVCVNDIKADKTKYTLTSKSMCEIDTKLATSNIGAVVNLGQIALSLYWEKLNSGLSADDTTMVDLLKKVDIMTILGGVSIDSTKKTYAIDANKQINIVKSQLELKVDENGEKANPNFWKVVADSSKGNTYYNCPMDHLYNIMSNLERAKERESLDFKSLLVSHNKDKGNRKQRNKIEDIIKRMYNDLSSIMSKGGEDTEVNNRVEDSTNVHIAKISKLKVKKETMYSIIDKVEAEYSDIAVKLLNAMYKTQDTFMEAFR